MASLSGATGGKDASAKNLATIANASTRLKASGASLSPLSESYGDTGNQTFADQSLSALSPLMHLAGTALNGIERPSQGILHALQAFSGTKGHITPDVLKNAGKGFVKGVSDTTGKSDINLRGAMNQDPNKGGRLAGLFDTVGTGAIDPLTYVTLGTSAVGKVGLKIIGEQLGDKVAQQVAKHGVKALSEVDQAAVRKAILESDQAAAKEAAKEGGAQNLVDKIVGQGLKAGALEDGNGLKFAGKTILKSETLRPAAELAHLPQATKAIKGTKAAKQLEQMFVPGAKLANAVGGKTAEAIQNAIRLGRAKGDNATSDVLTQTRAAVKGSGANLNEVKDVLTPALAPNDSLSLASRMAPINAAKSQLDENGQKLVDSLVGLRRGGQAAATAAGATVNQTDRVITQQAVKEINRNQTPIAKALGLDAHASPGAIQKHLQEALPNAGLQEADARFAEQLGLKNVFKTNPIEAATDVTIKMHRDAATAETLQGLEKITDGEGNPILLLSKGGPAGEIAADRAKKLGYEEANTVLGRVWAPKEVLTELTHASVTLTDDHALSALGDILDKWGKLWRGYATVPTLFGLGFHERNLVGNVFNMWLGGFRDVSLFRTTDKIGRAIESGTNKGLTLDDAIEKAQSLSPNERQWVRQAYKEGVVGDSFFRTDQATSTGFKDGIKGVGDALDKTVGLQGPIIKSGTYVGRRIEDNSRLAMFIDQMKKHGDPEIAAKEVKKALFDYSELTDTEKAIKRVVPFYTYMRKNTPLQLQSLLKNPGKFSNMAHLQDNMEAGAPEIDGKSAPQYALQSGAIPILGGNTPVLASMATPFDAAMSQIQPLLEIASQAPGSPNSLRSEGGTGKGIRELLGNFGGGPLDVAKYGVEQATGKSLLTGSDLPEGQSGKRLAKALIPLYGKGDSTITDLGSNDSGVRNARLLAALTGLSTTALTDKASGGETSRRAQVLSKQAQGTKTLAELRKTGKAPKAAKKTTAKKAVVKKTAVQKAVAARKTAAKKATTKKKPG